MLPRLEHVCFDAGGRRLLDDVDLALEACDLTVLIGPNGAGKTLLLRVLHGLVTPTSGRVSWSEDDTRRRTTMVFQKPVLLRRSVAANVRYALALRGVPRSRRATECDAVLERTGLTPRANQHARTLSGGEQQRLAITRAWATEPQILLLDEPTANLDPAAARGVEDLIGDLCRSGVRVVLATHDLAQARRLADRVVFLLRGKCIDHAPADQFFDTPSNEAARAFLEGDWIE